MRGESEVAEWPGPVRRALRLLEYDPRWLEWGFLTEAQLPEEAAELGRGGSDPNTEHYRWAAFCRFLERRASLSEEEIRRFIALAEADPDPVMAGSALLQLVDHLSEAQLHQVRTLPVFQQRHVARAIARHLAGIHLRERGADPEFVAGVLASPDPELWLSLLDYDLPEETLQKMAEDGPTRRVRNMAAARLRRVFTVRKRPPTPPE